MCVYACACGWSCEWLGVRLGLRSGGWVSAVCHGVDLSVVAGRWVWSMARLSALCCLGTRRAVWLRARFARLSLVYVSVRGYVRRGWCIHTRYRFIWPISGGERRSRAVLKSRSRVTVRSLHSTYISTTIVYSTPQYTIVRRTRSVIHLSCGSRCRWLTVLLP